jgi:thiamine biosynthesis lipoprotein ApbE/Na+-translocating ferredoxin:NAD+ oxidoreductase RnfG subunit
MAHRSANSWLLRAFRAGVLIVIAALVHEQSRWFEAQRKPAISLRAARKFFSGANRVQLRDPGQGLHYVTDSRGDTIGCLLTTSPFTDEIVGYSGPNNLLIALDDRGTVVGLEVVSSGDTLEHVAKVRGASSFLSRFIGWQPSREAAPKIEGVTGATLTSLAMAESVQQRLGSAAPSLRFPEPVTLTEVQALFANATRFSQDKTRLRALDSTGRLLGFVLRTSPQADNISGYRGPSECLIALAPDGRTITAIRVRRSYDTDSYVDQIRRAEAFWKRFIGHSIEEFTAFEFPKDKIEGVSGATQTARALAEGTKRRLITAARNHSGRERWQPPARDWALAAIVAGALVMSFTSLRGRRWVRIAWQALLVAYVGLVNHDLLSLALLGGWAANGLALKTAPGLVLLAAAALLLPWVTRHQVYCHHLCPHGAAQQLLGGIFRRKWSVPARFARVLERLPTVLLGLGLFALLLGLPLNIARLEPFDAWAWRTAGVVLLTIAAAGLVASLFVTQAFCRFGCPTGALLSFVRSSGSVERWGRRDWTALAFVAIGILAVTTLRLWPHSEPAEEPLSVTGRAMGTTWSVKIRDEVADSAVMEKAIAGEFEWAESLTSHWRTNTDLSIFNRTATTNPLPVGWPVLTLARWAAEISEASGGAFDITVGPLVRLWGFGPPPRRTTPPSDAEIAAVQPAIGWQKLELLDGLLRKEHPALEIDLSSIAEGWAVDHVAGFLERRGFTNFLVEIGGELQAHGLWTIAIEHPTRTCTISNESISTSGTYRKNFTAGGRQYSHLIDPRTGRPITHQTVSVTVRLPDCARADAWSTALNVLGVEAGLPLAERLNLAAQFVIEPVPGRLEVRESSGWKTREAATRPEQRK